MEISLIEYFNSIVKVPGAIPVHINQHHSWTNNRGNFISGNKIRDCDYSIKCIHALSSIVILTTCLVLFCSAFDSPFCLINLPLIAEPRPSVPYHCSVTSPVPHSLIPLSIRNSFAHLVCQLPLLGNQIAAICHPVCSLRPRAPKENQINYYHPISWHTNF